MAQADSSLDTNFSKEDVSGKKLDPEFFSWLDSIQAKYSPAIKKLAKKS